MKKLLTIASLLITSYLSAQTGIKVDEANTNRTPNASAIFDAEATTKGILIPQLSLSSTNVAAPVTTPANSLLIYNTATAGAGITAVSPGYYYWDTLTDVWVRLLDPTNNVVTVDSAEWIDSGDFIIARKAKEAGNDVVITDGGRLGLKTNSPQVLFQINDTTARSFYLGNTGGTSPPFGYYRGVNAKFSPDVTPQTFIKYGSGNVSGTSLILQTNSGDIQFSNVPGTLNTREEYQWDTTVTMTLTSQNYVGIGTQSPKHKLHVEENILVDAYQAGTVGRGIFFREGLTNLEGDTTNLSITTAPRSTLDGNVDGLKFSAEGGLWFNTLDQDRMIITNNGNIGIGTMTPENNLHLHVGSMGASSEKGLTIEGYGNSGTDRGVQIKFKTGAGGVTSQESGAIKVTRFNSGSGTDMSFYTRNDAGDSVQAMLIDDNGNVGIGTTAPAGIFHAGGDNDGNVDSSFIVRESGIVNIGTSSTAAQLVVKQSDPAFGNQFRIENDSSLVNTAWRIRIPGSSTGRDGTLEFVTSAAAARMVIEAGGNVGIGLTNPTEALEVVGNIRASGNFISGGTTLTVPDYVFEKYYEGKSNLKEDYTFRSLEEIEKYTKENKHLPGITSAKEIKDKNEFNITQSSLNNLEKIEELYLHMIELNKENKNLKLEVERLKNENKEVESLKREVEEIKILLKELQKQ